MNAALIAGYFGAIVLANLIITEFGPSASLGTAFVLIGATLVVRDRLHLQWEGRALLPRMAALILAGGAVSYLLNADAGRIALASCAAFLTAEAMDALLFSRLKRLPWFARSNSSNLVSAAVDSLVFVLVAFGPLWTLILAQWGVKVAGGMVWTFLVQPRRARQAVTT